MGNSICEVMAMNFGEYEYRTTESNHLKGYLWEPVLRRLIQEKSVKRILDLGCGNGAFSKKLAELGYDVVGVDTSESGIAQARLGGHAVRFETGSAYDDLKSQFGEFDCLVSLEVVEHLYSPKTFAANLNQLLKPGGLVLISTPFHGYWKNLVMAITGKMDAHFMALWEHGHIKFWSVRTLTKLLENEGLKVEPFLFAGRNRVLAKSMIAVARKPGIAQ